MAEWVEKYRWLLFPALVGVGILSLVLYQVLRPEPPPVFLSTATPPPTPTARPLRVYVSGAVHYPDVYTLEPESIVKDAITAAGGPADQADLDRINLAHPLVDGEHVYVPSLGEDSLPVQLPSNQRGQSISGGGININTADLSALDSLPGIGPALAQRILDYRQVHGPFARCEDIVNVSGIGPATFERIQDLITTE
jgi:competence protein ComEA